MGANRRCQGRRSARGLPARGSPGGCSAARFAGPDGPGARARSPARAGRLPSASRAAAPQPAGPAPLRYPRRDRRMPGTAGHQPARVFEHGVDDLVGLAAGPGRGHLAAALAAQRGQDDRVQPVDRGIRQPRAMCRSARSTRARAAASSPRSRAGRRRRRTAWPGPGAASCPQGRPGPRRRTARTGRSRRPAWPAPPPCSPPPRGRAGAPATARGTARSCRRSGGTGCPRSTRPARPRPRCWRRRTPARRRPRGRHPAAPAAYRPSGPIARAGRRLAAGLPCWWLHRIRLLAAAAVAACSPVQNKVLGVYPLPCGWPQPARSLAAGLSRRTRADGMAPLTARDG